MESVLLQNQQVLSIFILIFFNLLVVFINLDHSTLRKDFVILQLYWWLFRSTKQCS